MPAIRINTTSASSTRRRRSSHLLQLNSTVKPGTYGLTSRPVTFAPNVTPGTFVEPEDPDFDNDDENSLAVLFPPSEKQSAPPTRKRCPPGKRLSQGYIPRPPNAFMLFRADFVKQRHVPGSIETNHGSLSKIIGNCWRQLPLDEKRVWEKRAKEEKDKHKIQYPDYRFRPVHNKNKNKLDKAGNPLMPSSTSSGSTLGGKKEKPQQTREEELRCDQVAALLLEGKKGEELALAVRTLDREREMREREGTMSARGSFSSQLGYTPHSEMASPLEGYLSLPSHHHHQQYNAGLMLRRPSSVPLPLLGEGSSWLQASSHFAQPQPSIAIPHVPFMSHTLSRPVSPSPMYHQQQFIQPNPESASSQRLSFGLSQRRPSSVGPIGGRRSWTSMYGDMMAHGAPMPFFNELGIDNPFANHEMAADGGMEMETAGEPDFSLFNGFSFSSGSASQDQHHLHPHQQESQQSSSSVSAEAPNGSPYAILAPHDLPPLDLDHAGWAAHIDHASIDTSSAPPSASISGSSHASSPEPSEYTPSTGMFIQQHPHPHQHQQQQHQQGMYTPSMGISPFDLPLDPLSSMAPSMGGVNMGVGMHQHQGMMSNTMGGYMTESYDGFSGHGDMGDGGMMHAPKPITPTNGSFGHHQESQQLQHHQEQQQQHQYFEPVVYSDEYAM